VISAVFIGKQLLLNEAAARCVHFGISEYREILVRDLETRMDGHPDFGQEDIDFLTSTIKDIDVILEKTKEFL